MEAGDGRGGIADGEGRCPLDVMPYGLFPPLRAGGRGVSPPPSAGRVGVVGGCWRCWASRAARTAASCSAFSAAARASAAATSMSWALAGFAIDGGGAGTGPFGPGLPARAGPAFLAAFLAGATSAGVTPAGADGGGAGLAVAAFAGADFAGADGPAEAPAAISSRSRRATGASTVLDADLTNSPISFSLARTVLLCTPSSLASSCTRALPATALLNLEVARASHPPRPHSFTRSLIMSATSSCVHVGRPVLAVRAEPFGGGSAVDKLDQRSSIWDAGESQRAPESAAPQCQAEASRVGVQMRSPPRHPARRVGHEPRTGTGRPSLAPHRDHSQELGRWRSSPAAHTSPHPWGLPLVSSRERAMCHRPV